MKILKVFEVFTISKISKVSRNSKLSNYSILFALSIFSLILAPPLTQITLIRMIKVEKFDFFFSTIFKLANLNFKTLFKFSSIKSSKQVPKSYRRSVTPHQSAGLSRQTSLFTTTLWNYRTFHHRIKLIGRKIENFYRVFPDAFARAVNPLFLNSGYTNPYSKDPANIRATNGQEFVYRIATTSKHERVLLSGDEVGVRLYHNGPSHTNIFRSRQM